MLVEVIILAITFLFIWRACQKPQDLPPGKWGLPLIGYFPLENKYLDFTLEDFRKKFGNIYVWRLGTTVQVYIHDYHILKQIFNSFDFTDRPDLDLFKLFEKQAYGISGSNGAIWENNRRFSLRHLRDLGMGKSSLVLAVQEQAKLLVEALKKSSGKPEPISDALGFAIMNVIWKMTANKHFDLESPKHKYLAKLIDDSIAGLTGTTVVDMMPWMKKIFPQKFISWIANQKRILEIINQFNIFFDELIDEHKANLDPDDPKDFIDAYLIEMKSWEEKGGHPEAVRSDLDLRFTLFDLLFAGTDTTKNNMKWLLIRMAAHPEIQQKMQKEIDEVLPKGTNVTLEDKARLPYTEAVINESLRMASLINPGLPHCPSKDTIVAGYRIPKGALVNSVTVSMHYDPRYWNKPNEFQPGRWLSSEGKFVMQKEGFIPFGVGKRSCIGESLARMELLIFTCAIFQNFSISSPEGKEIDLLPDYDVMFMHVARQQDVVFSVRQ